MSDKLLMPVQKKPQNAFVTNHTTLCKLLNDLERGLNYLLTFIRNKEQSDVSCRRTHKIYKGNIQLVICSMMLSANHAGSYPEKHLSM